MRSQLSLLSVIVSLTVASVAGPTAACAQVNRSAREHAVSQVAHYVNRHLAGGANWIATATGRITPLKRSQTPISWSISQDIVFNDAGNLRRARFMFYLNKKMDVLLAEEYSVCD